MQYLATYLATGPPVYFVVKEGGLDYTNTSLQQKLCGGYACATDSLVTQIFVASKTRERSYISSTPASWVDDYLDWLRNDACCKTDDNGEFCPSSKPDGNDLIFFFKSVAKIINISSP